jgi:hypothetical protein
MLFSPALQAARAAGAARRGRRAAGVVRPVAPPHGTAVQVASMKPVLKAPGTILLKLGCDVPLSNFAFNVNLRR